MVGPERHEHRYATAVEHAVGQGPSSLKNFGEDTPYCLRFDGVTMFTQP